MSHGNPENMPCDEHSKFPKQTMVLGVIASTVDAMPPYYFKDARVDHMAYIRAMKSHGIPWMTKVANGRPYVFQQDGTHAHTAKKILEFLEANCCNFHPPDFWPPSFPDLNPMDFICWSIIEAKANDPKDGTQCALKHAIMSAFKNLDPTTFQKAYSRMQLHAEAIVSNNGNFIE